jgi:glycine dehydrogenase subunit 1
LSRYTSITDEDRERMLAAIGVGSVAELFERQIPERMRLGRALDLPAGMGEQEVYEHLRALAGQNVSVEEQLSFLGGGMYDHYVPAIVEALCERSEFLTPYTPYQPEVSQGGLQAMFEYQTAICELTGLPVSNASVYEGPSALASAGYMAKLHNGRGRFVVSAGLHPHSLQTLATYAKGFGAEIVEAPLKDGATDEQAWSEAIDGEVGAAFFAQPNFYGAVEDAGRLVEIAKGAGAAGAGGADAAGAADGAGRGAGGRGSERDPVVIAQVDPVTLGILRSPGECGVDVAVGEGQPLGGRLDFGGPSFGFFAAREEYLRRMPGRIAGETVDADGRRGFVLTLQTREQHIRRERATSNICTAQALNALAGVVHLAWLGREGIVKLGELLLARTDYAKRRLCEIEGVSAMHERPAVRELALRIDGDVASVKRRCLEAGVNPGVDVHALTGRERDRGLLLVAITERRGRADIDRLAEVLGAAVAERRGDGASAQSATEAVGA